MRHPDVGDLYLTRTKLDIPYSAGQHILTFHAPPDSASIRALDRLRPSLPPHPVLSR